MCNMHALLSFSEASLHLDFFFNMFEILGMNVVVSWLKADFAPLYH